ncbi:DUF4350 domain-containing protein [Knoellia sp. Soil729]|uniref:DUF4350 domain-containing protein n=1 Tax=Knoellia sp. Soil729 TaxID=1736394 RepID=UPI0006FA9CC7|nr:DUF4350 domain-containing protein [Knoellia sp. Soil729]KRE43782.1 hypothetical protein ASG74_02785 [Knoellia sp. Soil729]
MSAVLRWRRAGLWLLLVALGVGALAAIAIATTPPGGAMDPEGVQAPGAAALVAVLEQNGVDVQVSTSIEDVSGALRSSDAGTSLVVANTTNLGTAAAATLRQESVAVDRLVVLSPSTDQLRALGVTATALPIGANVQVESRCQTDTVDEGDSLLGIDTRYESSSEAAGAQVCFPLTLASQDGDEGEGAHGAGLLELPSTSAHAPVTVVGSTAGFSNGTIRDEDNAAIALRLLGGSPRLLWYQPDVGDLAGSASDDGESGGLLPAWLAPALALLATSLIVLALVRGRRLGRLVREPLPVVVRAVETTESRGRLYRRAQDRPRAAAVLRIATLDRLRSRLGLRRADSLETVARAVAAASGRPVSEVLALVAGPEPTDDAALVRLAQDLSDLEEKAHRT